MSLYISNLGHRYPGADSDTLHELNLEIGDGEILAVLGPSGCGKSTLLRSVMGLEAHQGDVILDGTSLQGLPPEKRNLGMVFQDGGLFPHMSVIKNIRFGLRGLSNTEIQEREREVMKLLNLQGLSDRFPHQLSGGQRQRVAIGRALVRRPSLMLLDEPFSSLDAQLSSQLATEIKNLFRGRNISAMVVTHDQDEAFVLGDRVAVLHSGKLLQVGSPRELHDRPNCLEVARFIGEGALLADGFVRPSWLVLAPSGGPFTAEVISCHDGANAYRHRLKFQGGEVLEWASTLKLEVGSSISFDCEKEPLRFEASGSA